MESTQAYQSAKKRVEAKMGFYTHLSVYAVVIQFLAIINFMTSSSVIWFHWPMLGWRIAVALHAFAVFALPGSFAVTEEMIEGLYLSGQDVVTQGIQGALWGDILCVASIDPKVFKQIH